MSKIIAVVAVFLTWMSQAAVADWSTAASPVDFRACNFREGKSMQDLDKVTAKFREYANKNDSKYSAWTLTPQYQTGGGFDIAWLGAWPNGEAFGVSMERWSTQIRGLQAEFDQVVDCSGRHELAISRPINAPQGTPEDGILMFYACQLNEGTTLEQAYKAHLDAGSAMKGMGSLAVSWMFQPALGSAAADVDYYHVLGFYRYSDLGASMEMYVNGGGMKKQQAILGKVSSCQTPSVFDAISVRAYDER